MKIGILTFHNAINYGAVLQTYATQELFKARGYDVEVIDYHNAAIDSFYEKRKLYWRNIPKRNPKKLVSFLISTFFNRKRNIAYKKFSKKFLQLSEHQYIQGEPIDLSEYDVILIGSDQLWNKRITRGFDDVYWGNFIKSPATRVFAWSVCMNNLDINGDELFYIKKNIENFNAISVREDTLQSFLTKLTSKPVWHTLDPTLLLPENHWQQLCHEVKEKNYIAIYAVRKEHETVEFARKLSLLMQKPIIIIRSYSLRYIFGENKEYCSPTDFLSYIKNADLIVTTSFHGTVFSIIFEKQFVCPYFENNARINSLLKSYKLTDRVLERPDEYVNLPTINYKRIKHNIQMIQDNTYKFLDSNLSDSI